MAGELAIVNLAFRQLSSRALGGLEVDRLTYMPVVELLAEGAGSVGWNLVNNSIGQRLTLGLPDLLARIFPRAEAEVVPGSWDVSGLRGTGRFDWTVEDVFLPAQRTMVHAGVPLDNQWERWPGVTYALPTQCWVGPHHSAVITGIARAGIDALIDLPGGKTPIASVKTADTRFGARVDPGTPWSGSKSGVCR